MTEASSPKRPSWLWAAFGVFALAAGLGLFLVSGSFGGTPSSMAEDARASSPVVEYATIERADTQFSVTAPGRLEARQRLSVVGEIPGKVSEIHPNLETGGRIPSGEILLRIDQGDYRADLQRAQAQLATAEASLQRAEADRDRQVQLAEIGAVPAAQKEAAVANFASAEASVSQARAQLTLAQRNLAKTVLRAPFDAIVVSENLSPDTYVAPGAPLADLIDASAGEIRAGLSPEDVAAVRRARIAAGEEEIKVRALPNEATIGQSVLTGYLASFAPDIDPTSRTVAVRAIFPDAFSEERSGVVFAGDFMTLEIEAKSDVPVFDVPTAALRQESRVWLIAANDTLTPVAVRPLEARGRYTLVTSTVDLAGQRVMTTPLAEETDGMTVRPQSAIAQDNH